MASVAGQEIPASRATDARTKICAFLSKYFYFGMSLVMAGLEFSDGSANGVFVNPAFDNQDVGIHSVGNGEERINAINKPRGHPDKQCQYK